MGEMLHQQRHVREEPDGEAQESKERHRHPLRRVRLVGMLPVAAARLAEEDRGERLREAGRGEAPDQREGDDPHRAREPMDPRAPRGKSAR